MKTKFTLLLVITTFLSYFQSQAQTPIANGGFETWSGSDPASWNDVDQLIFSLSSGTVSDTLVSQESRPTYVHSGSSSAKLSGDNVDAFQGSPVIPGILSFGPVVYTGTGIIATNDAYASQPDSLVFWYRNAPGTTAGDTSILIFQLTKWNGTGETVVGGFPAGEVLLMLPSQDSFFRTTISAKAPNAASAPDSMMLAFFPGFNGAGYGTGTVWLDDVAFIFNGTTTNVNDLNLRTSVSMFPVPTSSTLQVTVSEAMLNNAYTIVDLNGQVVSKGTIESTNSQLNVSAFAPGTYIYTILDNSKGIAAQGKFIVNR